MAGATPLPSRPWQVLHCCSASSLPAPTSAAGSGLDLAVSLSEQPSSASGSARTSTSLIVPRPISSSEQPAREAGQDQHQQDQADRHQREAEDLGADRQ